MRRVPRHVQAERTWRIGIAGAKPERCERWRLAIRNHFAKVGRVGVIEAFGFEILDFARAQDFHGDAAGFALGIEKTKEWDVDLSLTRAASLSCHDKSRVLFNRFQEGHGQFVGLYFPIGHHCTQNLIDSDFFRDLNFGAARRALRHLETYFGVDGCRVFAETQELGQRSAHA